MTTTTTAPDRDVYVDVIPVDDMFVDPAYQRVPTDIARAQRYAATWDRRLVGVLHVSDRGPDTTPRYAIVDGQHRWAAMRYRADQKPMAVNIHTGLTIADEAALFDKLNRERKQTNTWDHWKARRAAGDSQVAAIEAVARKYGLEVHMGTDDDTIACVSSLEKIVALGGVELLNETLSLLVEIWHGQRDSLQSPIVHGTALVLHYLSDALDLTRLGDTLVATMPQQLRLQAASLKEISPGSGAVLTAMAIVGLYNKRPGRRILVSNKTFSGKVRAPKTATE